MNTNTVTLSEAANLIRLCGDTVTFLLQGEPGIGKSALLTSLSESLPDYKAVYLEAQTLDLGDIQMPVVSKNEGVSFVPNEAFMSDGRPLLLLIDEIGKAMRPTQNALLRVLHEGKLGAHTLPAGSRVFATTNLATDGVGDLIQSHAKNRMTSVIVKKPDADEWGVWAANNSIDPAVIAWVYEYPHCLASYTDEDQADNEFIFNPKKQQAAFVSPRSLEKASNITKQREHIPPAALRAALAGTIGASAAAQMEAYLTLADALPAWSRVVETPETCPVPDNIAQVIMALQAVQRLTHETVTPWLRYLQRMVPEVQAMFATNAMKSGKSGLLVSNKSFTAWCVENSIFF